MVSRVDGLVGPQRAVILWGHGAGKIWLNATLASRIALNIAIAAPCPLFSIPAAK